jgi:hypothetical protein
VLTDILILGLARARGGAILAGMTTEPDPVTGLRWVRPIKTDGPPELDELRYADGALVRLGDVVQIDLQGSPPDAIYPESVLATFDGPLPFIRDLTPARRADFFPRHLDPDPAAVLRRRERSVCLVQPDSVEAIFSYDAEIGRFEARLFPRIGRLYSEDGVPVRDLAWQAWGRHQLGDEEYLHLDHESLHALAGAVYLVLALGPRGGPQVIGVHTVPAYEPPPDTDVP